MSFKKLATTVALTGQLGLSQTASALEAGDWFARMGAAYITATSESYQAPGMAAGADVKADDSQSLGFSIG